MNIEELLPLLKNVSGSDSQYSACCPVHDDKHASLSISKTDDGRILLHCHAGCTTENIVAALGLKMSDLFSNSEHFQKRRIIAEYLYCDADGVLLFKKIRYQPKNFSLARPDGQGGWIYNIKGVKPVLYHLPDVIQGVSKKQPIYIVEGEKDAETLKSYGLIATSTFSGAGNRKWLKQYNDYLTHATAVIIQDNDDIGKQFARSIAESLRGIADGVKLIDLTQHWPELPEHGDISDVFMREKNDVQVLTELQNLIDQTPEYLSAPAEKQERVSAIKPKCDEGLAELFKGSDYTAVNGNTFEIAEYRQLCNFVAWIVREKTMDDGSGESQKTYVIAGRHAHGQALPEITVLSSEFNSLNWVTDKWGLTCNINPGVAVKDRLRHCIQQISRKIDCEMEFTHTGWHCDTQNGWIYLNGSESIGADGIKVTLMGRLSNYFFPRKDDTRLPDALKATLAVLKVAPRKITLPLLAFTFLTPLNEFLRQAGYEPRFISILVGATNCGKSALTALFLSFFGKFNGGNLPMTFLDTSNAIIHQTFLCKDILSCVDDYKPSNAGDITRMDDIVQRIVRSFGEREGRARLNAKSELMENRSPRGNVILTAEQMPNVGESGVSRCIISELQQGNVDFNELTIAQENARNGNYALCMRSFIEWLKREFIDKDAQAFVNQLETEFMDTRTKLSVSLGKTAYPRVIEAFAHLYLGWSYFLRFAEQNLSITAEESGQLSDEIVDTFRQMLGQYTEYTGDVKPTTMFIKKIGQLINANEVYVHNSAAQDPPINQRHIGYYDTENYYFYAEMVYEAVVKFCKDQGTQFPLGQKALIKHLAEENLIVTVGNDKTPRHVFYNKRNRYLTIRREIIDGD